MDGTITPSIARLPDCIKAIRVALIDQAIAEEHVGRSSVQLEQCSHRETWARRASYRALMISFGWCGLEMAWVMISRLYVGVIK